MAISMEKVWTVAREKDDTPVFREWFGVKVQAPRCIPNERWILCKDPGRAAAFTVDPDKVFATQAKALASTKPVTCFFVEGFDVRKTKGFYNGAGSLGLQRPRQRDAAHQGVQKPRKTRKPKR